MVSTAGSPPITLYAFESWTAGHYEGQHIRTPGSHILSTLWTILQVVSSILHPYGALVAAKSDSVVCTGVVGLLEKELSEAMRAIIVLRKADEGI